MRLPTPGQHPGKGDPVKVASPLAYTPESFHPPPPVPKEDRRGSSPVMRFGE